MNYKEVKILSQSISGNCNNLLIDGSPFNYDIIYGRRQTILYNKIDHSYLSINIDLILNVENPKETIDKFFKLLLLA
jgi:hypothetical protein